MVEIASPLKLSPNRQLHLCNRQNLYRFGKFNLILIDKVTLEPFYRKTLALSNPQIADEERATCLTFYLLIQRGKSNETISFC